MEEKIRLAVFGQKRLSREGGIEIVVKEDGQQPAVCNEDCGNAQLHR